MMRTSRAKFSVLALMLCTVMLTLFTYEQTSAAPRPATKDDLAAMNAAGIQNPKVGMLWDANNPFVGIDAAGAKQYLLKKTSQPASHIQGMIPEFACRLARFIRAAEAERQNIRIISGYRSPQHQSSISRGGTNKMACGPRNGSFNHCPHVGGRAADLSFNNARGLLNVGQCKANSACQWAHQNAPKYGLIFPLMPGRSRSLVEPWHIEVNRGAASTDGSKCGDVNAAPDPSALANLPSTGATDAIRKAMTPPPPPPPPPMPQQPLSQAQQQPLQNAFQQQPSYAVSQPTGLSADTQALLQAPLPGTITGVPATSYGTSTSSSTDPAQKLEPTALDLLTEIAYGTSSEDVTAVPVSELLLTIDGNDVSTLTSANESDDTSGTSTEWYHLQYGPVPPETFGISVTDNTFAMGSDPRSMQVILQDIKNRLIILLGYLRPFGRGEPLEHHDAE